MEWSAPPPPTPKIVRPAGSDRPPPPAAAGLCPLPAASISRRTGSVELEHKPAQQQKSDSEFADLKEMIVELERKLAQQHKSNSEEVAGLKQRIDELLGENEYLHLKLKDLVTQRLDHLEEQLLDLGEKLHEEDVSWPRMREEASHEYLHLKLKDLVIHRLDQLEEQLLDLGEKLHEEDVPRPRMREEASHEVW